MSRRAEWKQYRAQLRDMDRELARLAPREGQAPSAEYAAAWHDRMGFAANRYPGAPEPTFTGPDHELTGPGGEPVTYVTEISVPDGDDGVQRLHNRMLPEAGPDGTEPEAGT